MRKAFILAGVFFSIAIAFALHRHLTFYSTYDQGIFNQVFWNNLHGRFFQSSLSSALSGAVVQDQQVPTVFYHRLGQHFTPALLLWLPFYALFPNATTLVFIQVGLITLGGLLLYRLARHWSLKPEIAWLITASYYASNAVIGPTFSNFHDLSQIPVFIFGLLLAFETRRLLWFWLLAVLTLLVREDTGVILFSVGTYFVLSRRAVKVGLAVCALSVSYILLTTNVFMAAFSEDVSKRFMIERFGHFTDDAEASTLEIIWEMIRHPVRLFQILVLRSLDDKVEYLLAQALPLAFVPLMSPSAIAIAGFPLLQLFLQQGESPLSIHIRYAISIVPGFFYGAVLWWSVHQPMWTQRIRRFWIAMIALSLLIAFAHSPHRVFYFILPDSYQPWVHVSLPRQWVHSAELRSLMNEIPRDASVSATNNIIPHLSSRRALLRLPFIEFKTDQRDVQKVDYILADLWRLQQYAVAFEEEKTWIAQILPLFDRILRTEYGVQSVKDGVILLQKGVPSQPEALQEWNRWRLQLQAALKR